MNVPFFKGYRPQIFFKTKPEEGCPICRGDGYLIEIEDPENGVFDEKEIECEYCEGSGKVRNK